MFPRYVGSSSSLSFLFFFFFFFLVLPLGYSQLPSDQIDAMVKLSELIQNDTAPSPWKNVVLNRNPCLWVRVSCSLNGSSIMGLSLHGFSISSPSILPVIGRIESLQTLDLSNNRLSSIPDGWFTSDYGGMNGLKLLNFSRNWLSGNLPTFQGFSGLETLDLSYNYLSGNIDLQLDGLVGLKSLNLSNNHFTGSVPTRLEKSMVLEQLDLSHNFFQGEIPDKNEAVVEVLVAAAGGYLVGFITMVLAVLGSTSFHNKISAMTSKCFYRNKGHHIPGYSLRSSIHFPSAMEAVSNPTNIVHRSDFCTCYKATMPCLEIYCVKRFNWTNKTFQLQRCEKFCQAIKVLGRLDHPNILTPLAYILTSPSALIVHEYPSLGTLFNLLHGSHGDGLSWESRHNIAVGVARGLAFLHGCTMPIILLHFSTKTILMRSLWEPLIADIELCRVIAPSKFIGSPSLPAGSVGYSPPEYGYTMRATLSGNVYSFGVILLELLTGKPARSKGTELAEWARSTFAFAEHENREDILDSRVCRTSLATRNRMLSMLRTALRCVSICAEERPNASDVLGMLLNDMVDQQLNLDIASDPALASPLPWKQFPNRSTVSTEVTSALTIRP